MPRMPRPCARRFAVPLLALLLLPLAAACGGSDDGAEATGPKTAPDGSTIIAVKMRDNSFDPAAITVKSGTRITFELTNVGKLVHNMRIAPPNGNYDSPQAVVSVPELINASKTGTLKWTAGEPGVYNFRCDVHQIEQVGTITVE